MGLLVGQSAGWQIKTVTYWSVDRSLRLVGPVGNRHRAQHLGPHLGLHSSGAGPRWGTPRASPHPPGAPGGDITVKPEVFLTPPRPRATVPGTLLRDPTARMVQVAPAVMQGHHIKVRGVTPL